MSRRVLKIAVQIGLKRRKFSSKESAENYFEKLKKEVSELVVMLQLEYQKELLDYSPKSLKSKSKLNTSR